MFKIKVFIIAVCISVTCLAGDNTLTPERKKALRELAKQLNIESEKKRKESVGQKGQLLYIRGINNRIAFTCESLGEHWSRVSGNASELKTVSSLVRHCNLIREEIRDFLRIYDFAEIAAENENKQKKVYEMLRQDKKIVVNEIELYMRVIDYPLSEANKPYTVSLAQELKSHLKDLNDAFGDIRLHGKAL